MTRTIGAALAAHIATKRARLSRCVRLDLRDGSRVAFTDHDKDLSVNLGDGAGAIVYRADLGVSVSDIVQTLTLEADNYELSGPVSETITRLALLGGRFLRARAWVFDVRWDAPAQYLALQYGRVAEAKVSGSRFTMQVRSSTDAYNQTIGRVLSPGCSWDFGVFDPPRSRCPATPMTWNAQVVSVVDAMRFRVDWGTGGPTAAEALNGLVTFSGGALAGTLPVEIFSLSEDGDVSLYHPLPEAPEVGATLVITEGCDKLRPTCKEKGFILDFGGHPDAPGNDDFLQIGRAQ